MFEGKIQLLLSPPIIICQNIVVYQIYCFALLQYIQVQLSANLQMGIVCSCSEKNNSDYKIQRKVSLNRKESWKTNTDASQSRIILQSLKGKNLSPFENEIDLTNFQVISELGKGGQADVFQIKLNEVSNQAINPSFDKEKAYALKRIYKKCQLNRKDSIEVGRNILMQNSCPFIINGVATCEDEDYIYHVMENATGGNLSSFLQKNTLQGTLFKELGEQGIRHVAAGVVLGLEYLHHNDIIYSDMKLENVLIGADGYPLLIDFEMASKGRRIKSRGYRGTVNYVAPQVFIDDQVDRAMDLWALGVLLHVMAYGSTPFTKQNIHSQYYILECKKRENRYQSPSRKISKSLASLINELLRVNPGQRLGYCSLGQIKGHSFFRGFDWFKYERKELKSPLLKIVKKVKQQQQFERNKENIRDNLMEKNGLRKRRKESAETACEESAETDHIQI